MATSASSSSGIGFFGLLTIVLITLKLLGVINWSWFLVFLPLMIGFLFALILITIIIIGVIIVNK